MALAAHLNSSNSSRGLPPRHSSNSSVHSHNTSSSNSNSFHLNLSPSTTKSSSPVRTKKPFLAQPPPPTNRAYQARLEKARNVQRALSQSCSLRSLESVTSLSLSSSRHNSEGEDDDHDQEEEEDDPLGSDDEKNHRLTGTALHHHHSSPPPPPALVSSASGGGGSLSVSPDRHPPIPSRYSMSSSTNSHHHQSHHHHPIIPSSQSITSSASSSKDIEEFEASLASGMVWTEVGATDKVTALAWSRTRGTVGSDTHSRSGRMEPLYLAVGTEDGTVMVTCILEDSPLTSHGSGDAASRRVSNKIVLPQQFTGRVRSLDFSPDGQYLAMGGDDCNCTVARLLFVRDHDDDTDNDDQYAEYTLVDLEVIAEVPRVDRVYAVQFSPDNRYLAVGGYDGTVSIVTRKEWTTSRTPEVLAEIQREGLIFAIDWSPDGKLLAMGGSDKCCALVDVESSWSVYREIRRPGTVHSIQWYPTNGNLLAIGSTDVCILDRKSMTVKHEIELGTKIAKPRHTATATITASRSTYKVNSMCWSPLGSYFVICGSDNKCLMLETKKYTTVQEIRRNNNAMTTCVVWGQQNVLSGIPRRYLALGGDDKKVEILKAGLELNQSLSMMGDDLSSSMGSTSLSSLFSQKSEWTLKEHAFDDVEDDGVDALESLVAARMEATAKPSFVTALTFSRGSKTRPSTFFGYAMSDGLVVVRSTLDWKAVVEIRFSTAIATMAFSNGSRFLALGTATGSKVYVTETAPSWSIIVKREFKAAVNCIAYSKHNERLAVGTDNGVLSLLDPDDNYDAVSEIDLSKSPVTAMDWTTRNFASGRQDGTVTVYDAVQVCSNFCVALADLTHESPVRALSFGVSSRFLAVGQENGLVSIYSARNEWTMCHCLQGPTGLASLAWNSSGRFLAVGGSAGAFQMVDTLFWSHVSEAEGLVTMTESSKTSDTGNDKQHPTISNICFSQDGYMLAVNGGANHRTQVIDTAKWKVCFRPGQQSDEEERRRRQRQQQEHSQNLEASEVSSLSSREEVENRRMPF